MKAVVQRVIDASVTVNGILKGSIGRGLLVYLGVALDDTTADADWLAEKAVNLRIFDDSEGKMNLSLLELVNPSDNVVNGTLVNHDPEVVNKLSVNQSDNIVNNTFVNYPETGVNSSVGILAISQFTLLGDARKGRRPSWGKAAPPEKARELYQYFIEKVSEKALCQSGEFQAHMEVTYTNDGPVTILLDSSE